MAIAVMWIAMTRIVEGGGWFALLASDGFSVGDVAEIGTPNSEASIAVLIVCYCFCTVTFV
jgi:hypothetical protein